MAGSQRTVKTSKSVKKKAAPKQLKSKVKAQGDTVGSVNAGPGGSLVKVTTDGAGVGKAVGTGKPKPPARPPRPAAQVKAKAAKASQADSAKAAKDAKGLKGAKGAKEAKAAGEDAKALTPAEQAETAMRDVRAERRRGPRAIEGVLTRLAAAQTLEAGYHAWDELRSERGAALERFAEDGRRLGAQAGFWIGAARAAATAPGTAGAPGAQGEGGGSAGGSDLAESAPLQRAAMEAEAKLKAAAAEVEAQARKTDAEFAEAELHVRAVIKQRVQRYAATKLKLLLTRHPAGPSRVILHLPRISPDESVVLMFLLSGKLPTRYGFLFDDSTENAARPPPWLYPDEGVAADWTRPAPRALEERLMAPDEFAPVKGFIPLFIQPPAGGEPVLHRLLQRGAVMEAEILDADDFRNALTGKEAEQVAGAFLKLKLEGRIDLELEAT